MYITLGLGLALLLVWGWSFPSLGWGVGPWCRVGPSSLGLGLVAFCGDNFLHNYNQIMTNISEGGGKKKTGVGPSGRGSGRGWPFGSGLALSFSGLVLVALRGGVGFLGRLALPSWGWGWASPLLGRGWPEGLAFPVGLALPLLGSGLALPSLGIKVGTSFSLLGLPRGWGWSFPLLGWPFLLLGGRWPYLGITIITGKRGKNTKKQL